MPEMPVVAAWGDVKHREQRRWAAASLGNGQYVEGKHVLEILLSQEFLSFLWFELNGICFLGVGGWGGRCAGLFSEVRAGVRAAQRGQGADLGAAAAVSPSEPLAGLGLSAAP